MAEGNMEADIQRENNVWPKEIQGHPVLNENLSNYTTFYGYNVSYREKDLEGLEVVKIADENKSRILGTVVNDIGNDKVDVKWVNDNEKIETFNNNELLLFNNAHKDVPHAGVRCYGCTTYPLKGIRWQCLHCQDIDLCTMCYMNRKHNLDHEFKRIINHNSEGKSMFKRNASVTKNKDPSIQNSDTADTETQLFAADDKQKTLELSQGKECSLFYPEQLPALGQCSNGCFISEHCADESEKHRIKVYNRRQQLYQKQKRELAYKPLLYLIFDSPIKDKNASMDAMIAFANKTNLPCHILEQKVLFHNGSSKAAGIHYDTDKATIDFLIGQGFHDFERMDRKEKEDEILYFKRMTECAIGKEVLPVIISFRSNGKIPLEVINRATESQIPIIHFEDKNMTKDEVLSVLWLSDGDNKSESRFVEYKAVTELSSNNYGIKAFEKKNLQKQEWSDGIARMSNIGDTVDFVICNIIVAVCFEDASSTVGYFGTYHTASSMYLLKGEKSIIYKRYMKDGFYERYLECINLIKEEVHEHKTSEYSERTKAVIKFDFECYGLIFAALLQKKYWDGALQLLEAGYIGIHHILVGCVELEKEINNGKTEKLMKEKLKRLKKALTDKAVSITSHIFEADKQNKQEKDEYRNSANQSCTGEYEEGKLSHAGRILLNHGYLRDAITTKNNAYLESDTVKKILRKTFYGTEAVKRQTTLCFGMLTAVHMLVLPSLMINMETRPLRWFYEKYKLHYMKVYIHMFGFLSLLIAYSNMLLFDYRARGITYTDYFIILWMASFFVDETNQIIVAVIRGKWNSYSIDWWNLLDWLMIALYTTGMLLKTGEGSGFQMISKLFLIVVFTALCTRLLHLTCMTEFLGRKLVINRKMIKDTSAFMIIITIIMLWYSVSFYALLYPNSDFSWKQMEKILRNGYWMLFGDLNIDATDLECTHNKTMYDRGILQRCPSDLGVYVTPYLKAFYGLLAVVLLLNLLIAMYSDTYTKVQQNANLSWLEMQIDLFEEYRIKTVFPIHLQLLALPGSMIAVLWYCFSYLRNKWKNSKEGLRRFNDQPVFVRVFLYDANYDIKPKSTYIAEENAVRKSEGKIDLSDSDAITTMNKLEKIEEMTKMLIIKQENMEKMLKEFMNKIKN